MRSPGLMGTRAFDRSLQAGSKVTESPVGLIVPLHAGVAPTAARCTISLLRRASVNAATAAAMSTRLMAAATRNSIMVKPICFLKVSSFFGSSPGRNVTDERLGLLPARSHVAHDHGNLPQIQNRIAGFVDNRGDLDLPRHARQRDDRVIGGTDESVRSRPRDYNIRMRGVVIESSHQAVVAGSVQRLRPVLKNSALRDVLNLIPGLLLGVPRRKNSLDRLFRFLLGNVVGLRCR